MFKWVDRFLVFYRIVSATFTSDTEHSTTLQGGRVGDRKRGRMGKKDAKTVTK